MRVKALVLVAVTLILAASAWASSESVLYNFCSQSSCVDGYIPYGSLVADTSGNHLYGTTYQGGANGYGEVFELTNSGGTWSQTVIYSFTGPNNGDGTNRRGGYARTAKQTRPTCSAPRPVAQRRFRPPWRRQAS